MITAALLEALDATYAAFATTQPRAIDGCPCCIDRKGICTLLAKPLRNLTADDLSPYAASVFLTVGNSSDFRYFLPRILELSVRDREWWPTEEITLGKLKLAGWQDWSRAERNTVHRLLDAWFDALLQVDPPEGWLIDTLICGIGLSGIDISPYLQRLALPAHMAALAGFYAENSDARTGEIKLGNSFWRDDEVAARPIIALLEQAEVRQRIGDWYISGQPNR